jgi:hypothetical protein
VTVHALEGELEQSREGVASVESKGVEHMDQNQRSKELSSVDMDPLNSGHLRSPL